MKDDKPTFKVIDSPTGKGKTTALINMINKGITEDKKYLIVTPYLDEVERICSKTNCREPIGISGSKRDDIKRLLVDGYNVCCTHALFELFDEETRDILLNNGYRYTLIIDEEPQVVRAVVGTTCKRNNENPSIIEMFAKKDYDVMISNGLISIDPTTKFITWNYDNPYNSTPDDNGIFDSFRQLTEIGDLYTITNNATVIAFTKPDIWKWFDDVYISSYRVRYGYFYSYCRLYNLGVEWYHIIDNGDIALGEKLELPLGLHRIRVYNDTKYLLPYTLSKTWYNNNHKDKKAIDQVKTKFRGYLRYHIKKLKAKDMFWTVFKAYSDTIKGKDISIKRFVQCNKRATNDYKDCTIVGVLCDRYPLTMLETFFNSRGITIDRNEYTLNELIQFIWRSNIRDNSSDKDIHVYIPHKRMRDLFSRWLSI